jgi:hypothetical protein
MQKEDFDPIDGCHVQALDAHLSVGWLLNPARMAQQCQPNDAGDLPREWALCARLPEDLMGLMRNRLVPQAGGVVILTSPEGFYFGVAVLQFAATQIRLLVNLDDPDAQAWLREGLARGKVAVAFEGPQRSYLHVLRMPCKLELWPEVESRLAQLAQWKPEKVMECAAAAVKHVSAAHALPTLVPGFVVETVRVVMAFDGCGDFASQEMQDVATVH